MIDALSARGRSLLARFLARPALLAFDLDGTLAPIEADPAHVRLRPSTADLFARLCSSRPCAVVTGRPRSSAVSLLRGTSPSLIVGSHGAEWPGERVPRRWHALVSAWRRDLARALSGVPGIRFEAKPAALSVHYRLAPDRRAARAAVEGAAAGLAGCRAARGLLVVNLTPADAPGKGRALERACLELGLERAVFVGDDAGDEEAFEVASLDVLGIRLGPPRSSRARLRLASQRRMDDLLAALLPKVRAGRARS